MTVNDILSLLLNRLDHHERILEEMVEMWGRSKAVAWFFTKLASLIAIVAAGWSWAKDHIK